LNDHDRAYDLLRNVQRWPFLQYFRKTESGTQDPGLVGWKSVVSPGGLQRRKVFYGNTRWMMGAASLLPYRAATRSHAQGSGMGLSIRQASFPDKSAGTSFDSFLMGREAWSTADIGIKPQTLRSELRGASSHGSKPEAFNFIWLYQRTFEFTGLRGFLRRSGGIMGWAYSPSLLSM
jgi:hypothetical protein